MEGFTNTSGIRSHLASPKPKRTTEHLQKNFGFSN